MKNRFFSASSVFVVGLLAAGLALGQDAKPSVSFSGYVDADFVSGFAGGGLKDPTHTTGLEIDLTTTVTFNPKLNAVLYTTMNDGIVPAQGAGKTWDDVNFDGVAINWLYNNTTTVMVGDLIYGTGYFNYYGNKRSAVVVGEHAVRGVGVTHGALTVTTGATNLGAGPTQAWGTFAKYDFTFGQGLTLTPSAKYTAGIPGATPINAGLSFDGKVGGLTLSADIAGDYYNEYYDPGFTVLVEPLFASGAYSVAGTIFYNKKGRNTIDSVSPTAPRTTSAVDAGEGSSAAPKVFDDLLLYVEPGYSFNDTYAVGLPLEYHDPDLDLAKDESIVIAPTFYVYPGSGVQWWLWAGVTVPTASGADPIYTAGSEIIFKF